MANDDTPSQNEPPSSTAFKVSAALGTLGVFAYLLLAATVAGSEPAHSPIAGFGYFFVMLASPVGFIGACLLAYAGTEATLSNRESGWIGLLTMGTLTVWLLQMVYAGFTTASIVFVPLTLPFALAFVIVAIVQTADYGSQVWSGTANRWTKSLFGTLLIAIAAFVGSAGWIWQRHHSPSTAVARDNAIYYRLKVGLTYKGQPIDVNIVAGCGVRATFGTAQGGSTVETMAMSAFVFGVRMPEGHAVVIRSDPPQRGAFKVCRGVTTSGGDVPRDWLPFIVWYEHDDNFAHGIGYATQDAYESPRARFGFRGASIERATRAEFEAFQKDGPANLLPSYLSDATTHLDAPRLKVPIASEFLEDPTKAWRFTGSWPSCLGVYRIRLTEDQRAKVRRYWPVQHPEYWVPKTREIEDALRYKLLTDQQQDNDYEGIFRTPYTAEMKADQAKVYPILSDDTLFNLKISAAKGWFDRSLTINDPSWLGFVFCDSGTPTAKLIEALAQKPVDTKTISIRCRVENTVLTISSGDCSGQFWTAFQSDEYEIVPKQTFED